MLLTPRPRLILFVLLILLFPCWGAGALAQGVPESGPPSPRWVVIKHETLVVKPRKASSLTPLATFPYNGPVTRMADTSDSFDLSPSGDTIETLDDFVDASTGGPAPERTDPDDLGASPENAVEGTGEAGDPYADDSPGGDPFGGPGSAAEDPFADGAVEDDPFANGTKPGEVPYEKDPFASEEKEIPPIPDPFEGFNRSIHWFNDQFYDYLLKPVATTYRDLIHENIRILIRNAYDNATAPVKLASSLAQGDMGKSGRVISRLLINTTLGWGGMIDVAGEEYGIESVDEDFGQTLGFYGIGSGPYLVLPILGPSSFRHLLGRGVDSVLNPTFFFSPGFAISAGITAGQVVNEISFRVDDIETLRKDALDPYVSLRDFYHKFRELAVQK